MVRRRYKTHPPIQEPAYGPAADAAPLTMHHAPLNHLVAFSDSAVQVLSQCDRTFTEGCRVGEHGARTEFTVRKKMSSETVMFITN